MTGGLYSFDTSAFIKGRRDLLPPDVFATLWTRIEQSIASGMIRSSDEVRREIVKRDDAIKEWAAAQSGLFVPLDEDIQKATRQILSAHPKLMGKGGGRNEADPFVIALACARKGVVVTEETRSGNLDKPRIPDVCDALGVPCLNLVEFSREQRWTF
ncbi:DUF4411 family protein [Saccharothrix variisporea]|uniref:DUF4411 family protein n=1 Tax=Saccharothrix variisporea TaxID=543527 RepID=UPI000EB3C89A|nr:DUF4411 family protein [Saccharothrix variisporea]